MSWRRRSDPAVRRLTPAAGGHTTGPSRGSGRAESGWAADPTGRFEQRFFDGRRWTRRVRVGEAEAIDTLGVPADLQPDTSSDRPEPGWRPDPDDPSRERYHDGWQLTIKSRPADSGRRERAGARFPVPRIVVGAAVIAVVLVALVAIAVAVLT